MEAIHSDVPYIFCNAPKDSGKRPPWPLSPSAAVKRLPPPPSILRRYSSFFPAHTPSSRRVRPRHNCSPLLQNRAATSLLRARVRAVLPVAPPRRSVFALLCIFIAVHVDSHFKGFEAEDDDFEEPSIDPASLRSPPSQPLTTDPNPNPNPQSPPTSDLPKSPPTTAFDF
ncbi:hypothetical protein SESBI_15999 [Sesbania bispinosa]|nr:hypothetical protein SESBI_15999 [Sesbania bispinosa]